MSKALTPLFACLACSQPALAQSLEVPHWRLDALLEMEAFYTDRPDFADGSASDLSVATLAFGVEASLHPALTARISTLYEQDDTPLEIDEAVLVAAPWKGVSVTVGRMYVPFGRFETQLISDPFTLTLGEARETAAVLGYTAEAWSVAAFAFNGDMDSTEEDHLDNGGLRLDLGVAGAWSAGISYLSDVSDADAVSTVLQDLGIERVRDDVPAYGAHLLLNHGTASLAAEYLEAGTFEVTELAFDGAGAAPAAWRVEAGYGFTLAGREASVAAGYQQTREALALGLPAQRYALGLSVQLMDAAALGFEYAHDSDYDRADGGSGETCRTLTAQLAVQL
jgi:hypothetical protein